MKLDFSPGLKTGLGGIFLLINLLAPGVISDTEAQAFVEAVSMIIGSALVIYGTIIKLWRWWSDRKLVVKKAWIKHKYNKT